MPYRVSPDGTIECDTAEEAVRLQALIAANQSPARRPLGKNRGEDPEPPKGPDYAGYWRELNKIGRTILGILSIETVPIPAEVLVEKCGITTKQLPSKMIHVRRTARRFCVPEPVIRVSRVIGKKLTGVYEISSEAKEKLTDPLAKWRDTQK